MWSKRWCGHLDDASAGPQLAAVRNQDVLDPVGVRSGIMLAVTGPGDSGSPGGWLQIHRISFIAWAFFIVIHVLAYVWRLPRLLAAEARGVALPARAAAGSAVARRAMEVLGGRGTRPALLTALLLAGLVIALLTVHLAGRWEPGSGDF